MYIGIRRLPPLRKPMPRGRQLQLLGISRLGLGDDAGGEKLLPRLGVQDAPRVAGVEAPKVGIGAGAAPATGNLSIESPMPPSFTISTQAVSILELSTQLPT